MSLPDMQGRTALYVVVESVLYVDVLSGVSCASGVGHSISRVSRTETRHPRIYYKVDFVQRMQQDDEMRRSQIRPGKCLYEAGTNNPDGSGGVRLACDPVGVNGAWSAHTSR
jgi:hypothetical protein